jgi:hypothetical protein
MIIKRAIPSVLAATMLAGTAHRGAVGHPRHVGVRTGASNSAVGAE